MKSALLILFGCLMAQAPMAAENYFIKTFESDERLCPKASCPSTNKIYKGQAVTVFEKKGGWARVSNYYDAASEKAEFPQIKSKQVARWVRLNELSTSKPGDASQPHLDAALMDSKIQGISKAGENGVTAEDVTILRTYAAQLIKKGECSGIEYGDKSVSRKNTYFVTCTGESQNRFFTKNDLR